MHIHILGICGTFMAGLAILAKQQGHTVSGSDNNVYPPMSTQLQQQGITLIQGYKAENLAIKPDMVIIGNALSRGNCEVEAVLNQGLPYISGAQWLLENVLHNRWVLAVAGTHGKTTTSSLLTWLLTDNGIDTGFLIGGIPLNFGVSAHLGTTNFFVVEADEYDSAFFDKRSKFVHYRPRTAILNNLEYDHADIFPDLAAIQKQFHHLIRTVPSEGLLISPANGSALNEVIEMGCWTPITHTAIVSDINISNAQWTAILNKTDGSEFSVYLGGQLQGKVQWTLTGQHNVYNALSAIAAARHIGITPINAINSLAEFKNVKRRMEVLARTDKVTLYDDFAHHPTAIETTLEGLRKQVTDARIIAIIEPRSNTMRLGVHSDSLARSLHNADLAIVYQPENVNWNVAQLAEQADNIVIYHSLEAIVTRFKQEIAQGGHFVLMSNGSFGGIYTQLQAILAE
ncbi:MAG: UDP-N-acetylmuramate:L-alanyl-gamma-D-glutamyl-meso-diaminopimelate ligase [Methylococcaceae bacterium]